MLERVLPFSASRGAPAMVRPNRTAWLAVTMAIIATSLAQEDVSGASPRDAWHSRLGY